MMTDLKFFTNEPERDLYSRFSSILKSNTQFFDVLVGYFRTSGFFRLADAMKTVKHIRILVGLNVDRFTVKIIDRAKDEIKYAAVSANEGKRAVEEEIEHEFEQAEASEAVEKGVRVFIDWLKSGKLEMRMYTAAPIHAKVYIMRKDPVKVPDTYGSVITGSSNFSEAGLINNLEFNVELKDTPDVKFALDRFEALWEKAVDIRETYIDAVEKKTWMRDDITPYQLYLKTLYEFFKEEINADKENFQTLLPDGYMRLQYQIDAVMQARQKLEAYNGVFISDVVGLGKTYICAMLANSFNRNAYSVFTKLIGDKYFTRRSINDIIQDYKTNFPAGKDKNGKKLYRMVCSNLEDVGINKGQFIQYLCEDICQFENFETFIETLRRMLS